jgi:SAM-dependent methyltransferase
MLDQGRAAPHSQIDYRSVDTRDAALFEPGSFDLNVSRQAVCCLEDPIAAFKNWHCWLRPDGQMLIVDGFWQRSGWRQPEMVEQLPLSCVQTCATAAHMLQQAGFGTTTVNVFAINAVRLNHRPNASPLYAVIDSRWSSSRQAG